MKILKTITLIAVAMSTTIIYSQSDQKTDAGNSSTETVTKIIRIKGPNGEEKVIKKQEVITKKSKIQFNPDDENKTNQTAIYADDEVAIQKSHSSSDNKSYTKIPDKKGFLITFIEKSGNTTVKIRPVSGANGYYIVHYGQAQNNIGYFDENDNLMIESYDSKMDEVVTTVYKLQAIDNDKKVEN